MSNPRPLQETCVVLTRPPGRSMELTAKLESLGATVFEKPLIGIQPLLNDLTAQKISQESHCDGVIVTSANAVRSTFAIRENNHMSWALGKVPWYCIGKGTAQAVEAFGIQPIVFENVRNSYEFGEALVEYFQEASSSKLIFLHGQKADLSFVHTLESARLKVIPIVVYETHNVPVEIHELNVLQQTRVVVYVFYSPSAVESFIRQWPDFSRTRTYRTFVVTIGQTTSSQGARLGVLVDKVARKPTAQGILDAIVATISHAPYK